MEVSPDGLASVATATFDDMVMVRQIVSITTNPFTQRDDIVNISYTYTNLTSSPKQVGVRIMLDVMLGSNDGAPFRVNGTAVTHETEFVGDDVPQYWQAFDSLEDPGVISSGIFYFNEREKPDKVQFVYWPEFFSSALENDYDGPACGDLAWSYTVDPSKVIVTTAQGGDSDSAVVAYFEPRLVAAGGEGTVSTYYGISDFTGTETPEAPVDPSDPSADDLATRVTAPTFLYGDTDIGGYVNNPFDVTLYLSNMGDDPLPRLKAVLDLSQAQGMLRAEDSQPTTVMVDPISSMGTKNIKWTLRGFPQSDEVTVPYSIYIYSGSTLVKTLDLSLRLEKLKDVSRNRTVTFNLNGAGGTAPASQKVLVGEYASKPGDPARSGYCFAGWYANSACTGVEWFSVLNQYKGYPVTDNITLYAKWVPASSFSMGFDAYQFTNSSSDFGYSSYPNYMLTGDYYDLMMNGLTTGEKQSVLSMMQSDWGGSCFGMSSVLSLARAHRIDPAYFQSGATCLHDLAYPKNSMTVRNLVNYYQVTQITNRTGNARRYYVNEAYNCQEIIEKLDASNYPVVLGINLYNSSGYVVGGHAIVALGYTVVGNEYQAKIWDPNDKYNFNTLHIGKSDFSNKGFDLYYSSTSRSSYYDHAFIKYGITVESQDYDYRNLQNALLALGYSSGAQAYSTGSSSFLTTNYTTFTISDGANTARVENGVKVSGSLDISDADYLNEAGQELLLSFALPDGDPRAATYTITPETQNSIVTGTAVSEYVSQLVAGDTVFAGVTTQGVGTIQLSGSGTVSTSFTAPTAQKVTVARDGLTTGWDSASVESTSTGLTVAPSTAAVSVTSNDSAPVDLTVNNDYNAVSFSSVATGADGVSIGSTAAKDAVVTSNQDSSEVASGDLAHAVIFYTLGGEAIETQTGIASGATATEPQAPTRPGYVFSGWYTDAGCTDGNEWDFDTPVTADVRIYAKWLMDNSYSHIVTFRAVNRPDVIITVLDGESLADDQVPAPPIGAIWDVTSFSNITSDVLVNASYSAAGRYAITLDPNGGTVEPATVYTVGGKLVEDLPTPTKAGYDFDGWFSSAEGGSAIDGSTVFTQADTIYAHWTETPPEPTTAPSAEPTAQPSTQPSAAPTASPTPAPSGGGSSGGSSGSSGGSYTSGSKQPAATATPAPTPAPTEAPAPWTNPYPDVNEGQWYYSAVAFASQQGLMKGMETGAFAAEQPITRAMVMTILGRLEGADVSNSATGHWYDNAVNWAVSKGISDGSDPDLPIIREQMVAMIYRMAANGAKIDATNLAKFSDITQVSPWAIDAMAWAVDAGLISGTDYGALKPGERITRAEAATVFTRYCQNFKK